MFASATFADEREAQRYLDAIEGLLRQGRSDEAAAILDQALEEFAASGHAIVPLCRNTQVASIRVVGWDKLVEEIAKLDAKGKPITALGIDITDHRDGMPSPCLETNYYSDAAFAFSTADRNAVNAGYEGKSWQGCFEDIDWTLSIDGMTPLSDAVDALEADCRRSKRNTDGIDHDALLLGAAVRAVRLHQAIREMVFAQGLPRAMTVIVGSHDVWPFFDAPAITRDEYEQAGIRSIEPAPAAAEEIAPEPEPESPEPAEDYYAQPPEPGHVSGPALRRMATANAEIANPVPEKAPGLLARLLGRK